MDGLLANAKVLNRSTQVFDGVGSGEYPLGITLEYAGFLWAHNGAPVNVVYPAEGTYAVVEGAAILKGGPNPEPAKRLVDYLASKDVQEMLLKATFRRPARQDIDLGTVAPAACCRSRRSRCCPTTMPNGKRPGATPSRG